ncbi:hypothetical protein Q4566_04400 [Tamlana sp. 2_MG-2023]|uniref:hypothetical protein n=1 Tax=unclassified Tamlana TaxID=2614803 RepID=UPI0026E1F635|nr:MULTISPECIES: hypothetical protein [unclassified Tamlana]MDO6759431.1 hypothetical protein [Tamlana sp. 2_MG-2023]MDO6790430.1 hypothetical protein [Tamlana sp. 1_MG-2023]
MKLIQRIGYYLGGFSIGLVLLAFFLSGKKTSCSYGPDARVLKNINTKKIQYSSEANLVINQKLTDSTEVLWVLKKGDINFSESKPRQEPCGYYAVEGEVNDKDISLIVENCDSIATIKSIKLIK